MFSNFLSILIHKINLFFNIIFNIKMFIYKNDYDYDYEIPILFIYIIIIIIFIFAIYKYLLLI
jgi:hypothetical protein